MPPDATVTTPRKQRRRLNPAGHVLLVTPDAELLELLGVALRTEGFAVTAAQTSAQAMKPGARPPDVAAVDGALGEREASALIASLRRSRATPVIVLAPAGDDGWIDPRDVQSVRKPFSHRELIFHIRTLLRQASA